MSNRELNNLKTQFSFHKALVLCAGGDTKPFAIIIICGDTVAFISVVVVGDMVAFIVGCSQRRMGDQYHGYHSCITNSLQECGLASIASTNDKNTKVAVLLTNLEGTEAGHVDS